MNGKNDGDNNNNNSKNNNNNSSRVEMEIVTQSAECGKWAVGGKCSASTRGVKNDSTQIETKATANNKQH